MPLRAKTRVFAPPSRRMTLRTGLLSQICEVYFELLMDIDWNHLR